MRGLLLFRVGYYLLENLGKSITKELNNRKLILQYNTYVSYVAILSMSSQFLTANF